MTASAEGRGVGDDLPPALQSMWRLCKLGYRHEPALIVVSFTLALLAALPDALIAFWLTLLGKGLLSGDTGRVRTAAIALALSATATWFLVTVSTRVSRRFRDKVTIALESHVATLQASIPTIAHQERPDYLDRLSVLRNQVFMLDHMYMSLFSTCGWILRLGVTIALLTSVHPSLVVLVLFALPPMFTSTWRPGIERAALERGAASNRLARHLFDVATTASPGKEVRVTRIKDRLVQDRRRAWEAGNAPVTAARWASARWHAVAWAVFGAGYVGGIVLVSSVLRAAAGDVLLMAAAGARLSFYVGGAVSEVGFLRGVWMDSSRRLAWLEDYAESMAASAELPAPTRLKEGIQLHHVSFAYPGTTRLVLEDVNLELPAGKVVAIVGENGAGKSTLVKLLAKMYHPTSGRITVDGIDLARIETGDWRARLAGAFQDFFRFEFRARHTVGVGDLPRLDDEPAVARAVERAGAADLIEKLPDALETQLGAAWPGGTEVSFGQWQKLALARGFMRDRPLVLILDEPTAALDAETEHALFERYAAAVHQAEGADRITILVSHRFSTVRMADLIVVLDGARVVEAGTHEALMERQGQYAQLYGIQAAAYR
ncbi:MAG TPA: ABC transporter ATP-binding protein [Vicinamibacterales bacterium]|nr:ABC transporter ATP-binding protein [Vicinamibacterales bacterium]